MPDPQAGNLATALSELRDCDHCEKQKLIPQARPIFQIDPAAKIGLFSQAPGNLAHQKGQPFLDPSGVRLREWLGVTEHEFYDPAHFAIVPMAFCFPGYDGTGSTGRGGDRPPPRVCAKLWRERIMSYLEGQLETILLIGKYAQDWHMVGSKAGLTERVARWRDYFDKAEGGGPLWLPLPHPSWRNSGWLKKNPWFEKDVLPRLRERINRHIR